MSDGFGTYETLKLERHGAVGWLINNRPDQLNAMNALMRDEFAGAWIELDRDPEVRVIVHTGEGRAFQTGVDVTELATDGQGMERYRESVVDFDLHFTSWHQRVAKPVITAVNGLCAGGGFHWVADADIVIAAADAQFFDPHVSVGQVVAVEAIGLLRKMPFEAVMRDGHGWPARADVSRARVPAGHDLAGRRSAFEFARRGAKLWPRRSRATRRPQCGPPNEPSGERWRAGSPMRAVRGRRSWSPCGVIPIRRKDRARSPSAGRPPGSRSIRPRPPAADRAPADGQPA